MSSIRATPVSSTDLGAASSASAIPVYCGGNVGGCQNSTPSPSYALHYVTPAVIALGVFLVLFASFCRVMANIRVRMDHEAVQELRELRMQRRGVNKAGVELGEKPKIYTVYLSEKFDGIELGPKDGGISLGRMQPLCAATAAMTAAFPNAKSDESRDASYSPPSTGPDINRAFPSRRFRLKRSASPSLLTCAQSTATLTTTVMISMPTNRGSNQKACTIGANMRGDMPGGQVPDVAFGCRESEWRYGNSNG